MAAADILPAGSADRPAAGLPGAALPVCSEVMLPATHWPYYSRRLACWWLLDVPPWRVPAIQIGTVAGSVPAWRLTPASFAWFWAAVANLCSAADKDPARRESARWAVGVLSEMDAWLTKRADPAAVRRALLEASPRLPEAPPAAELGGGRADYSFNARRGE